MLVELGLRSEERIQSCRLLLLLLLLTSWAVRTLVLRRRWWRRSPVVRYCRTLATLWTPRSGLHRYGSRPACVLILSPRLLLMSVTGVLPSSANRRQTAETFIFGPAPLGRSNMEPVEGRSTPHIQTSGSAPGGSGL